jgi:hypothetical protein
MPVLVVFPDEDDNGWRVENIGNGAALNIIIAQGRGSEATGGVIELRGDRARRHAGVAPGETWCNPIHLRPMSADSSQTVRWPFSTSGVGISYTDALSFSYTLRMSREGSELSEERCVPAWRPQEILPLSELEAMSPNERAAKAAVPWGVRPEAAKWR